MSLHSKSRLIYRCRNFRQYLYFSEKCKKGANNTVNIKRVNFTFVRDCRIYRFFIAYYDMAIDYPLKPKCSPI